MIWVLVVVLTSGPDSKMVFKSKAACEAVRKEIMMSTLPKLQTVVCVKDKK